MFAAWGSWVARFRWPVLAVAVAAVIGAGVWGSGVFGQLSEAGYIDPGSESTRAAEVVQSALGAQGGDIVVIYAPTSGTIDDAVLAQRVENRLTALSRAEVTGWTSYWAGRAPQYAAADRSSAVAVLTLAGADDAAKLEAFRAVKDRLDVEGARTLVAGGAAFADATS
ncbi:MAG TPA: MMPL domain-containing protein, partial [Actinoplanes sp.]